MQAKTTERTLRDLFEELQARGETDLAAGVYLAVQKLRLPTTAWHPTRDVGKAAFRGSHKPSIKTYASTVGTVTIPEN